MTAMAEAAIVLLLGLALGSFATALAWRVPRGISWIGGRSACTGCKKPLTARDLVPVLSWLAAGGKCRHCGAAVSWRYPLAEAVTAAGCLGIYAVWGFTVPAFLIMAALPFLMALLMIDAESMILPDSLVAIAAILSIFMIIYQYVVYGPAFGFGSQAVLKLAAAPVYGGLVWLMGVLVAFVRKKDALGFGDVKFFAMAGLWLGLSWLPFFLIGAGLCGVFTGLYWRLILKKNTFPFGPALILALYAGLLGQGLELPPFPLGWF